MTDNEFYTMLVSKTGKVALPDFSNVSLSSLCYSLTMNQVTLRVLENCSFGDHKGQFEEVFHHYVPRQIVGQGQYLAQLNHVLEAFQPESPSPYKDLTKAVFLSAKYLSAYSSVDDYKAKIQEQVNKEKDVKIFLEKFRLLSSLPKMYFWKACSFFSSNGILEVPSLTPAGKDILIKAFSLSDENGALYQKVLDLSKENNVSVYEINLRLAKLSRHA